MTSKNCIDTLDLVQVEGTTAPIEGSSRSLVSAGSGASRAATLVGAGAVVLWGGTAIANKIAVGQMDPMTAGVLRSMLAGGLAAAFAITARLPRPTTSSQWALLLTSGVASFAVWPMMLSLGLAWTTANHAALILAVTPAFTGMIGSALERRRLQPGWWAGVVVAFAGTTLLVFYRSSGSLLSEGGGVLGDSILLVGTAICAFGYVTGARLSPVLGTWATTFWGLASALVVLVPVFALRWSLTDWAAVRATGWVAIGYLAVLSSIVGYAAWFWALGHGGIARIATFQLSQPVLTVALAAWLLGEAITIPLAFSAAAILAGTALAQRAGGGAKRPSARRS